MKLTISNIGSISGLILFVMVTMKICIEVSLFWGAVFFFGCILLYCGLAIFIENA